jgi:hypothetical protein
MADLPSWLVRFLEQAQEFRHMGAQLGLTPAGVAQLGWVIEEAES